MLTPVWRYTLTLASSTCSVEVSPFDIESELLEHPAVAECAAVSSPDEVNLTGTVSLPFT